MKWLGFPIRFLIALVGIVAMLFVSIPITVGFCLLDPNAEDVFVISKVAWKDSGSLLKWAVNP